MVYLNLFGRSTVKVGVAARWRRLNRVLEQGAVATLFIAEADGLQAREIERAVSRLGEIREHMRAVDSVRLVVDTPSEDEAHRRLMDVWLSAQHLVAPEGKNDVHEPEFIYHRPRYGIGQGDWPSTLAWYDKLRVGDSLSGVIVGVVGRAIVLRCKGEFCAVDARALAGYKVMYCVDAPLSTYHAPRLIRLVNEQLGLGL